MVSVYYLNCPKCNFRYYVGEPIVLLPNFPSQCPKCHHTFQLDESPTWKARGATAGAPVVTDLRGK